MKIINIGSKIPFLSSSIVIQNTSVKDLLNNKKNEDEENSLEKQPPQDEFMKETIENQERYKKELEEKNKQFQELINKPQKFHK